MFKIKSVVALSLFVLAFSGQASAWSKKQDKDTQVLPAQSFVDEKMNHSIASLDASMGTLVTMSRGGTAQLPRKSGPIGDTAAGADVSVKTSAATQSVIPSSVSSPLDKKIDIQWNGKAEELLSSLSKKIGYTFHKSGNPESVNVKIMARQVSVRQLLEMTAMQLNGVADIHVSSANSKITLTAK